MVSDRLSNATRNLALGRDLVWFVVIDRGQFEHLEPEATIRQAETLMSVKSPPHVSRNRVIVSRQERLEISF
jgi:hypothetical protein